jgi:hypothetical protein
MVRYRWEFLWTNGQRAGRKKGKLTCQKAVGSKLTQSSKTVAAADSDVVHMSPILANLVTSPNSFYAGLSGWEKTSVTGGRAAGGGKSRFDLETGDLEVTNQ